MAEGTDETTSASAEPEAAGNGPESAEADAPSPAEAPEEGAVDAAGGDEVPDMPVSRSVRTAKEREWEEAFNDVRVELTVVLGRASMQV